MRLVAATLESQSAWLIGFLGLSRWGRHAPPPSAEVNSAEPPPTRRRSKLLSEPRCASKPFAALGGWCEHQLSKSAEPSHGEEAQKALLSEGRRRVPPPPGREPGRLGLKNTSLLGALLATAL